MVRVRSRMAAKVLVASLLVGAAVAQSAVASAPVTLAPGVYIDPTSPAGKQYSFPLGVLRSQGAGQSSPRPGTPAPLFGVGVTAPRATSRNGPTPNGNIGSDRHGKHTSSARTGAPGGGQNRAIGNSSTGLRPVQSSATLAKLAGSSSALPVTALISLLVLAGGVALGTGIGLVKRRR